MMPARSNFQAKRGACLARLRHRIHRIERGTNGAGRTAAEARFSLPGSPSDAAASDPARLDPLLAGGRGEPALHELVAGDYGSQPAVRDFGLALAASLAHHTHSQSMVLWCQRQQDTLEFGQPYGPGLQSLGLPPDRLLMVTGRRDADCLWAMEQGLASRSLLAVIGAVDRVNLTASRRLSLAARAHGTWCLLLPLQHGREPSAARTRWRIEAVPSLPDALDPKGLGLPSWQLFLERSENGGSGRWIVEWDHAAHHFHLAPPLRNRSVAGQDGPDKVARRDGPDKQASDVVAFDRTG